MSVVSVGIDLVDVGEVEESVRRFGARYLARVFTDDEVAYARSSPAHSGARLAARFAAKEAVIKLLKPKDEAIPWRQIEITRSPSGACEVRLSGRALRLARRNGIGRVAISLTHQGRSAAAVASALSTSRETAGQTTRRSKPSGRHGKTGRALKTTRTRK